MAKRIRCRCGTIFDPGESGNCPSCGAEVVAAAPPPPVVPSGPPPLPVSAAAKEADSSREWQGKKKRSLLVPIAAVAVIFLGVAATGAVVAVKYAEPVWRQFFGGGGTKDPAKDLKKDDGLAKTDGEKKTEDQKEAHPADDKEKVVKADPKPEAEKKVESTKDDAAPKPGSDNKGIAEKEKGKAPVIASNDKKEEKKEDNKSGGIPNPNPEPQPNPDPANGGAMADKGGGDKKEGGLGDAGGGLKGGGKGKEGEAGDKPKPGPGGASEFHLVADGQPGTASLEDTVENAPEGATIYLAPGTYDLQNPAGLVLERPLHLIGENKGGPVILVNKKGRGVITVSSKGVTLEHIDMRAGGLAAVFFSDGELTLVDCDITGEKVGIMLKGGKALTVSQTRFNKTGGPGLMMTSDAKVQFTECSFTGSYVPLSVYADGTLDLKTCKFEGNGSPEGGGSIFLMGHGIQVTADQCTFTGNTAGLTAFTDATLTLTNCTFTGNGVKVAPSQKDATPTMLGLRDRAKAKLTGCKFDDNRQGIFVFGPASAEFIDCTFAGIGQADAKDSFAFFSNVLSLSGKGATATLRKCAVNKAVQHSFMLVDGANITLEDTDVLDSGDTALGAGLKDAAPCTVTAERCKFNGNHTGLSFSSGTTATVNNSECKGNDVGLLAQSTDTVVKVGHFDSTESKSMAWLVISGAQFEATDSSIEKNKVGVQSGLPDKPDGKATVTLTNCVLDGNELKDGIVCASSLLTLKDCTFGEDGKVVITREKAAVVKADPPLPPGSTSKGREVADNDEAPTKKSSSKGRSSGSSSRSGTVRKTRPSDIIGNTIDQLERLKKVFR